MVIGMSDFEGYQKSPRLHALDVEYLTGTWEGPGGAAMNMTYEFCRNNGLGSYGQPTEKGQRLIDEYRREHNL